MRTKKLLLSVFLLSSCFILISPSTLQAQTLVRGPYLQSPGPVSMILRWRTDTPTNSRVTYSTSFGSTTYTADDTTVTTEHRVKLTGLSPDTKYHYIIGSTGQSLRGPDSLMHFTTAPDPNSDKPIRVWAIGDFGHGNLAEGLVRDSYLELAENEKPADIQLWLGDNAYQDGTDTEYQTKVFDSINGYKHVFMNLPFAAAPGNHDWASICDWQAPCNTDPYLQTGPYLDIIDPPTEGEQGGVPSHLKLFYSFDYGDVHFISLNSELGSVITPAYNWVGVSLPPFNDSNYDTSFTSPMLEWLKDDISSTDKKWIIAYWHQCPYSGQDDFTEAGTYQLFTYATRRHFNPILERYGVDLVLTGHDHNYQRSYLINGLYDFKDAFTPNMIIDSSSGNDNNQEAYVKYTDGPLANKGTVYVLQGNSSGGNSYSPIDHPVIYWGQACDTCFGSFIFDIDGDRLDGRYLTAYGEVLDQFTILKQSVTGIEENVSVFEDVELFPNPVSSGKTTISFTLPESSRVGFDVLDLTGRTIYTIPSKDFATGKNRETIDLHKAGLTTGTYLIRLQSDSGSKYLKFVY